MSEKAAHLCWALERKKYRAEDCDFAQRASAACGRNIRSLPFAGILDAP
jgi:hypothetical protein